MSKSVDVYKTREDFCGHGYSMAKRVNDIELLGKFYRQMKCTKCGAYKVKINLEDFVPQIKDVIIKIK